MKKKYFIYMCVVISLFITSNKLIKLTSHIYPSYEKVAISNILKKPVLNADDYKLLFYQTGLGREAIDTLLEDKINGKNKILAFQTNLFKRVNIISKAITPITYQEYLVDESNNFIYGAELAPYNNGYILVTSATYSLGWRHGHAAIIIDASNGYTLEAAVLGENSQTMKIKKWKLYPNFILLRLKNATQQELDSITGYTKSNLKNVPYKLSTGILCPKYMENTAPEGTQCAHLVWYPFMKFGYNLDCNNGPIVIPKNIAHSQHLEIVQVYGFDPRDIWP